jgi:DNA repair and recombination protein RAD54 and RAD54-like protein
MLRHIFSGLFDDGRAGRGGLPSGWEALSGKFAVIATMLSILWKQTDDKIVIVSNYTQTLDLLATLCREQSYPVVRLDGSTSIKKRQTMVRPLSVCHLTVT